MDNSSNSEDFNTHLDNLWHKVKDKVMTIWKDGKTVSTETKPNIVPAAKIAQPATTKETFVDDAAKHVMGCIHSMNAMGQDVVTAARHSYLAAEALWNEKTKRK